MRVRTGVFVSLMTVAMLLSLLAPLARAYIPEPYELYGVAKHDTGVVLDNGAPIRSFVDGVDYSNKTSVFSRPAQNDGYFDIDTYGNHRTNLTDPGTPWIKEGADDNEPIMYSWGDFSNNTQIIGPSSPWLTAKVFKETANWQTGLPPQAGNLNLPADAAQPPLVKIFSVTTNSSIVPYTDYVWLCNPTNLPVEASNFYLEKDILGSFNGPQVQIPAATIPPYAKHFVDTGDLDYFVESGDNLKLVWKNSGGPTGAFGGSDIVIDRVEFNKTSGGTLNWEPGNTIMNDEPAPGRGFQLNRSTTCRDTNSAVRDFFIDIEVRKNDPPGLPDPICLQGLCNWNIDNRLFHITVLSSFPINWTHHDINTDPQSQANVYISTLPNGVNKIWNGNVPGPTQSTTYTGLPLLPANNYCLGVQTRDASSWGPWAEMCFRTNGLPAPVNRKDPTNGATGVSVSPVKQVWWTFMVDPDPGDLLNYSWVVSTSPSMSPILASGVTTNNYSAPFATVFSTTYYWCVNETDGWQWVNQCNTPWQFTTGPPPTQPYANNLKIATYDASNSLRLHLINRADPLLDWDFNPGTRSQTAFHVQVRKQSDDSIYWELNNTGAGGDLSQVTYAGPALVSGDCYYYYVAVRDNSVPQLWSSGFSTSLNFCANTPPPVPDPLAPADNSKRAPGNTIIYWSQVQDADTGDTISYEYCVDTSDPPYPPPCGIATGTPTANNSNGFTTSDGTNYYWAVRAFDTYEYSAWSIVWNFTAEAAAANTPPTIDIQTPTAGERLKQGQQYLITWTMDDNEDPSSALIVVLTYRVGSGTPVPIAAGLTGQTSYQWTVPSNVESTAVTIDAEVTDTGGLPGTDTSPQFEIYKPPTEEGFPMIWVILILIIVVVLILVLFLLMKRKKPKEEEEAPAAAEEPAEEPAAEEEIEEEEAPAPAPPPKVAPRPVAPAPKPAAAAPTKTPAKTKECPSCGTIVSMTDKECFMCGAKL